MPFMYIFYKLNYIHFPIDIITETLKRVIIHYKSIKVELSLLVFENIAPKYFYNYLWGQPQLACFVLVMFVVVYIVVLEFSSLERISHNIPPNNTFLVNQQ